MSEKRLSFIIDPSKAKTGAERIKDSLRSIQAVADKLQKTMNMVGGGDVAASSKGVNGLTQAYEKAAKSATDLEKAQQNLAKSLQFWQQRTKDLNSEQYQSLLRLRESARQIEAYQKSMVSALTPTQRMAKAEQELRKNVQATVIQLKLAKSGLSQKNTAAQEALSLQKQLAQSEIRLKQAYSDQYVQVIKNREELKKRNRELRESLGINKKAEKANRSLADSFTVIAGGIAGISMGLVINDVARMADEYKALQNRIAVVTGTTEGMTEKTRELLQVARDSRVGLDAVADTFSKLSRVNKQYGLTQEELLRVTTTVSQAVSMSGATAQGAQGAMIQFAQALQNNFAAAAQEMNSIIEQTPGLAEAIADAMNAVDGVTTYTMGNIKKAATEGALDVEKVLRGLLLVSDEYTERFELSQMLLSQGWVQIKNSLTVYIGELDKSLGLTSAISQAMFDASEDVESFGTALVGLASAFTAVSTVVAGAGIAKIVAYLGLGGPILLGVAAIAAAIGVIVTKQLLWSEKVDETRKAYDKLANAKELALTDRQLSTVTSIVDTKELGEVEKKIAFHVARITEAQQKIKDLQENPPDGIFASIFGEDVADLEEKITRSETALKVLTTAMQLMRKESDKTANAGGELGKSLEEGNKRLDEMLESLDPVKKAWSDYYKQIDEVSKAGGSQEKQAEVLIALWDNLQETINKSKDAVGELSEEFQSFRSGLDPAYSAQLQYNNSMETLNKHLEKGSSLWLKLANTIKNDYNAALNAQLNERVAAGANAATGAVNMDYITRKNESAPERKSSKSFEKMAREFLDKMDKGVLGPQGASEMLVGLRTYADKLGALGEGFDVTGMRGTVEQLTAMARDTFAKPDYKDLTADELKRVFEEAQAKALEKEQAEIDAWKAEVESAQYLKSLAENQGLIDPDKSKDGKDAPKSNYQKYHEGEGAGDVKYGDLSGMDKMVVNFEKFMQLYTQDLEYSTQDNESLTAIKAWTEKQAEEQPKIGTINITVKNEKGPSVSGEVSGEVDFLQKLANSLSNVASAV